VNNHDAAYDVRNGQYEAHTGATGPLHGMTTSHWMRDSVQSRWRYHWATAWTKKTIFFVDNTAKFAWL